MGSIWENGAALPRFERLNGDIRTKTLIIGAGAAGLNLAYLLHTAGEDCTVIDSGEPCGGVTRLTTAKITAQHGLIYEKLIKTYGVDTARKYYGANTAAVEEYARICSGIDCDFERRDSFVYSQRDDEKIAAEAQAIAQCGGEPVTVDRLDIPLPITSAVGIPNGAQFHPLKYFCGIAKELRLFGYARALEIRDGRVWCDGGSITADNIVVATHFPFINKFGGYFLKMYQQRSYVLALGGIPADRLPQGMYIDEKTGGLSFRRWGDMLLLGGGSARTGCTGDALERLRAEALRLYPEAKIAAAWAAQDCMTLDGMPYVGQYSRRLPHVYVATGFNKWGMTSSMAAAMILRDALLGKPNEYAAVFSPARSMLHPQLAKNLASTFGNFCRIAPRCPHLGCALKYNKYEHSWDCPCHGSRFDERGGLLDGPAQGDKRGL